jgi:iron complex transport system substrate-binding protein
MRAIFCILSLCLFSCTGSSDKEAENQPKGYQGLKIKYSTGLRIWKKDAGYKVQVRNPQDTAEVMATWYFQKGYNGQSTDTIAIPVKTAALNSTTFIAFFDKLDAIGLVDGVTYTDRVMNKAMKRRIDKGQAKEITSAGELDFEKVLALQPSAFMAYTYGDSDFSRLEEQGIPVVLNMEYLESHPLGRAEWIKLVGCMLDKYDLAEGLFSEVEARYNELKSKAALRSSMPTVFTGSRYKDIWYAPGNASYVANYLRDAGSNYVFRDIEGHGSAEIDYEVALQKVSGADYWGMVLSQEEEFTMKDVEKMDEKYTRFKAFKKQQVFYCNTAQDDYFGDAVMEPHYILADLIAIFHPEILPGHEFHYFRPIESSK